jgi:hypothetical protein
MHVWWKHQQRNNVIGWLPRCHRLRATPKAAARASGVFHKLCQCQLWLPHYYQANNVWLEPC